MLNKKIPFPDIVIVILIITLPFLFYLYDLIPQDILIYKTRFFNISSGNYNNVNSYFWLISIKLLNIFFLTIWFISCEHWWKHAILVPLIIEFFKFLGLFNDKTTIFDEIEFISSLPITIPFILLILFLSKKMNNYSKLKDINSELIGEIDDLFLEFNYHNDERVVNFKNELSRLKKNKSTLDNDKYLNEILLLRRRIFNI